VAQQEQEPGLWPAADQPLPDQGVVRRLLDQDLLAAALQFTVQYPVPEQVLQLHRGDVEFGERGCRAFGAGVHLQPAQVQFVAGPCTAGCALSSMRSSVEPDRTEQMMNTGSGSNREPGSAGTRAAGGTGAWVGKPGGLPAGIELGAHERPVRG